MKWQEVVGLIRFTEAEFQELEQFMLSQYGIDLSKKRTLSECRLSAELEKEGITSLQQFMRRMEQDKTKRLETFRLFEGEYSAHSEAGQHRSILPGLVRGLFHRGRVLYAVHAVSRLHQAGRLSSIFGDHGNRCLGGRGQGGKRGGLSHAGACGYPAPLAGEIR